MANNRCDDVEYAVVYARYSSHSQGEQSIEGQIEKARNYAASKGYTIIHEYVDRAQSGRTDNRTEFQRMLKDTAKKQFQVIILWKVDRFGRNREEITINKIKCKKNGVRVEYVAEKIPNTPEGVILESVLEGFAEYYSLQLSQNIRRGQNISAEKCQSLGGNRPLGYLTDENKRFVIDPKTAPAVKMIFNMYAEGSSVTEIINELNRQGIRTIRGGMFNKNSLHKILDNEKYTGVYIYGDRRIEGGMPRIIEPELFQKVQAMQKINKRAPAHKWSRADYLLTDKLFCGRCGSPMVGECGTSKTGAKYNYYLCSKKKRERACDKKAVRQDWIENLVLAETQKIICNDELLEFIADNTYKYYLSQQQDDENLNALKMQLAEVEKGIANLIKAVEAGMFTPSMKSRMDELESQRVDLKAAISENELTASFKLEKDHILYFLHQFRSMDYSDRNCQRKLVDTFVNAIFIFDDKITLTFNYTSSRNTVTLTETQEAVAETESDNEFGCCASSSTTVRPKAQFSDGYFILFIQKSPVQSLKSRKKEGLSPQISAIFLIFGIAILR